MEKVTRKFTTSLKNSLKAKIHQEGTNYTSLHQSLITWYGNPQKCEFCGKERDSKRKQNNIDWANTTGRYNLERSNWKTLCRQCHIKLDRTCVLIYSGGLDSTTLLYWLKKQQKVKIYALSFDYKQRHRRELEMAKKTCEKLQINHRIIDINSINQLIQGSALTSNIDVPEGHYEDESMKKTVVPNRNAIMISLATAYAVSIGAGKVYIGVHSGDHAIYPDCRPEFIKAINEVTKIANYIPVSIEAPFLNLTKGEITKIGRILNVDYSLSWTCYKGLEKPCGKCGACQERIEAMKFAGVEDIQYKDLE